MSYNTATRTTMTPPELGPDLAQLSAAPGPKICQGQVHHAKSWHWPSECNKRLLRTIFEFQPMAQGPKQQHGNKQVFKKPFPKKFWRARTTHPKGFGAPAQSRSDRIQKRAEKVQITWSLFTNPPAATFARV